jgi:hydrogenase/urease accessory protein HupE
VVWKLDVGVTGLAKVPQLAELDASPFDETRLQKLAATIGAYLASGAGATAAGQPLAVEIGALVPIYEPSPGEGETRRTRNVRVLQTFTYRASRPLEAVTLRAAFFGDLTSAHRALVRVNWAGQSRTFARTGPTELALTRGNLYATRAAIVWDFLRWGIGHILAGYDHIAFLLCLIVAVAGLKDLILVVTAFTLAHSLTLVLSALDVIRVSSRLAEIGIAASIVYVAADNLFRGAKPAQRSALVFSLGLLHGLGLASELRGRLADAEGRLVWAIASFNVGVEIGQLVVATALFLVVVYLRRRPSTGGLDRVLALRRISSTGALVLGLVWLVARLGR